MLLHDLSHGVAVDSQICDGPFKPHCHPESVTADPILWESVILGGAYDVGAITPKPQGLIKGELPIVKIQHTPQSSFKIPLGSNASLPDDG